MKEISVVVPAYNAAEYLDACFASLLKQSFQDFEIIAVNDGSKDNTLQILNDYKAKYPDKFVIVSQENQGLSVTRNNGVAVASGKYIFFLDSDDYIKENALELLYNKAVETGCEVVCCNTDCVYPDKTVVIDANVGFTSTDLTLEEKKRLFFMYPTAWSRLYKREIFTEKGMLFEPGIWFEDVLFTNQLIPKLKSISYVDEPLYEYIQRPNSITYTYSDRLKEINLVQHKTLDYYRSNGFYSDYEDILEFMYVRYMFATYIKRLSKANDFAKFKAGVTYAIEKVKENFPNYRKNSYLAKSGSKGLYLKYFNPLLAYAIFLIERKRMN